MSIFYFLTHASRVRKLRHEAHFEKKIISTTDENPYFYSFDGKLITKTHFNIFFHFSLPCNFNELLTSVQLS